MGDNKEPEELKQDSRVGKRKTHRKSRLGCKNCKRRRIKCDELKPACTNCVKFTIECDYKVTAPVSVSPPSTDSQTPGLHEVPQVIPRKRGRPRKNWDLELEPEPAQAQACNETQDVSAQSVVSIGTQTPSLLPLEIDISNAELMYHYTITTSTTLSPDAPIQNMWRDSAILLGLERPYLLHFAFALSALHLSRSQPTQKAHYHSLSEHHSSLGLKQIVNDLSHLSEENCQAVWVSAILICFITFAKGPSEGDFLVFSEDQEEGPVWFPLLKGVVTMNVKFSPSVLYHGVLAPMAAGPSYADESLVIKHAKKRLYWEGPMAELRQFIEISQSPDQNLYLRAFDSLASIFEGTYGRGHDAAFQGDTKHQIAFAWLYSMDDRYIRCLQRKEPVALILLAHFALLMKSLDDYWFLDGWVQHIMRGVRRFLSEPFLEMIEWPLKEAGLM